MDYTRLKAERAFLGEREVMPDRVGSDEWMAMQERNLRRRELDRLLLEMRMARRERENWGHGSGPDLSLR